MLNKFALILLLFSLQGVAQNFENNLAQDLLGPCQLTMPLSFQQIENCVYLNGKRLLRVEDFLASLPTAYRQKFTLVHHSQSQQPASYENPRVILYGQGMPQVFMTFTGETKPQPPKIFHPQAIDMVEMITWNAKEASFEFYELEFPSKFNQLKSAKLSAKNPVQCAQCHTQGYKPNWQHYNLWPGVYAGEDDRLTQQERQHLDQFFIKAKSHPRYRWLVKGEEIYKTFPYTTEEIAQYKDQYPDWLPTTQGMPNKVLNVVLAELNFQRMVAKLKKLPEYQKIKFLVVSMLVCNIDEFSEQFWQGLTDWDQLNPGPVVKQKLFQASTQKYLELSNQLKTHARTAKSATQLEACFFNKENYDGQFTNLYLLLSLLFEKHGMSLDEFMMDFDRSSVSSFNIPGKFTHRLAAKLVEQDSELLKYFKIKSTPFYSAVYPLDQPMVVGRDQKLIESCQNIQGQVMGGRKLFELELIPDTHQQCLNLGHRHPLQIKQNCLDCHHNDFFESKNINKIAAYLNHPDPNKRMPPAKKLQLSESEKRNFLEYLKKRN